MSFKKNELMELDIIAYTSEGYGLGKDKNSKVIFVPGTAKGDKVLIKIVKASKNHSFGRLEKIISPSPDRIEIDCPYFSQCGGCTFRHIHYQAELEIKTKKVIDSLERIAGFDLSSVNMNPIIAAENPNSYRNKTQLPIGINANGEIDLGFYAPRSHRIIFCESCFLHPEIFTLAINTFKKWCKEFEPEVYDEETGKGRLRHLYLRKAEKTNEFMFCVVVNGNGLYYEQELIELLSQDIPNITSIVINSNQEKNNVVLGKRCRTAFGKDFITDELCSLQFHISPLSFYQVNPVQAEKLYEKAKEYANLKGDEILLDLYCGTGTIGLSMAKSAKKLIGVEIVEEAVENAKSNAELNEITNAEFYTMDAAEATQMLYQKGEKPDVIILDPPRKGCSIDCIETIAQMGAKRLVYVSCDPATLARDIKRLSEKGFELKELTPVDMFPRTKHVESVVLMESNH